jgi:hypothetical protein
MKNLKKIVLIAACSIGTVAFGQNSMNPQERTDYICQHVTDVSSEQRSRLMDVENEYQRNARVVGNPVGIDSLQKVTDRKIMGILSNMQYAQYQSLNPYRINGR